MYKILLADDEEALRFLISETLDSEGFEVAEARDGAEAIERLAQEQYALLILDYMMPAKTGIEVTQWLRNSDSINRDIPIILLTARTMEQDKRIAEQAGVTTYIVKPFPPSQLAEVASQLIARDNVLAAEEQLSVSTDTQTNVLNELAQREHVQYMTSLQEQLDQLAALVKQPDGIQDVFSELYQIAHKLKGSAPMFGFNRIGELADQLQSLCHRVVAGTSASSDLSAEYEQAGLLVRKLQLERDVHSNEGIRPDDHASLPMAQSRGILNAAECRLLVVDDDEQLRKYIVARLQIEGYIVDEAAYVNQAQQLLRTHKYDLCLLDLMMLPRSGYELFAYMKDDASLKWMPLIVLSGIDDIHDKIRCFHLGADDYVTKPFHYEELSVRIYSILLRSRTFDQLAFRDPLTGAFNRRYVDLQIEAEITRVQRYPEPLSIAMIDIDRFKSINDTYGHSVGDIVLQGLTHTLQRFLRSSDIIARYGGEEFIILFPNTAADTAAEKVENILAYLRQNPVATYDGRDYAITFSSGVAQWADNLTKGRWIELADNSLYEAKQQGRNQVKINNCHHMHAGAQQTETIVIAEQDPMFRAMLASRLIQLGYEAIETSSGSEAFAMLQAASVRLGIVGSELADMSGLDLLERLHGVPDDVKPLILLTLDRKQGADIERGLALGIDDYLVKPISMLELEIRIANLLSSR